MYPSSDSNSDSTDCNSKALPHFPACSVEKDDVGRYWNMLTCSSNQHSAQLQSKQYDKHRCAPGLTETQIRGPKEKINSDWHRLYSQSRPLLHSWKRFMRCSPSRSIQDGDCVEAVVVTVSSVTMDIISDVHKRSVLWTVHTKCSYCRQLNRMTTTEMVICSLHSTPHRQQ